MFRFFEERIPATARGMPGEPPDRLAAFYWFFVGQVRWYFVALLGAGLLVALLDATIPVFIGRLISLLTNTTPEALFRDDWHILAGMALFVLLVRPCAIFLQNLITNQIIASGFTNLVRWQSHWHIVRQSWTFFQHDFAGRIAARVMQTGVSVRDSVVASINAVWYIAIYGASAMILMSQSSPWLIIPTVLWILAYLTLLRIFVPRLRGRSVEMSEARSLITGRIVDSYTNIITVKLFGRAREEDDYVREAVDQHTDAFRGQLRLITMFGLLLATINAMLVVGTGAIAVRLWSLGIVQVGIVAMVLPLTWQIANIAGFVAQQVTAIFENIGAVQEGMMSIAKPLRLTDRPGAETLKVTKGEITFDHINFNYGRSGGIIEDLTLTIKPGEKIGLVGRSGAGKSTLVNLLLRFFDLEGGKIMIDGQNIANVTQESLREQISVVTQDTSLLHRSILDNIRYGQSHVTLNGVEEAARRAHAHEFIGDLVDWRGRKGYEAEVGERGIKLSGGQRQRIAIARVILKNAPILVLDEATSALDSEVEAAIQEQFETLMANKTVIAIAHRLSTIARMDRLIILDRGRIIESGSHEELLALNGHYASLWRRQSGGFLAEEAA
ncbi:ABC transporter ATP-binding protein [Kaistia dalseonensis]|uniref:ATP-binding cassette subfamily B multidrug efflux pump n=1 Tax=Kaistia dalseonensis TaxID=410840 RepID=A0ABU0HDD1_9HYPH|nr:ABC transporter ATP-binding protein [Kaistia dalseonensis]MCX5497684.1 ABC transporter ATP-binding protein [Kaistia dalseonensis]MDQ0440328.1 ATP-binding cassette subfamily B multidrug efflux pump [Kaistia dalseonensis]